MNCKNCGAQLVGMEHACPLCGAPVPVNPQQTIPQMNPNMMTQPVVSPNMAPNIIETPPVEPTPEPPQKDNKMFAIIIFIVAVAAIAVGVFLLITDKGEPINEPVDVPTENVATYAGYTFHFPLSYQSQNREDLGLAITDSKYNLYTFEIDYSHTYEEYKASYAAYPTETKTISSREYLLITITGEEGKYGLQYVTATADNTACFVGTIIKPDYSLVVDDELQVLDEFINSHILTGIPFVVIYIRLR